MSRLIGALFIAICFSSATPVMGADIVRTQDLVVDSNKTLGFSDTFGISTSGQSFSDRFSFNVGGNVDLSASVISIALGQIFDLDVSQFSLTSGLGHTFFGTKLSDGALDIWTLRVANLPSDRYTLEIDGRILGLSGGSFGGNLNVDPIPEPATYAMTLLGLGLLALVMGRRKASSLTLRTALAV